MAAPDTAVLVHADLDRRYINDGEVFITRIMGEGQYATKGLYYATLTVRGRVVTSDGGLTANALLWIQAVRKLYAFQPSNDAIDVAWKFEF